MRDLFWKPSLNIFQHELGCLLLFLLLVLEKKSWFLWVWLVWQTLSPPCLGHVGRLCLPNDTWQWHHRIILLTSPLLSLLTIPTRTTSQQPPTSDLTPQTSSDTENQFIFPAGLESKVGEKQVLVGSQVRSEARYLQVNLSIFIISLLRRNSLCPSRCNKTKGFLLWCLLMSS